MRNIIFLCLLLPAAGLAQQYSIDWSTIGSGGGTGSGGTLTVADTAGQPAAGTGSGGNFTLTSGFWSLSGLTPTAVYTLNITAYPSGAGTVAVAPNSGTYVPGAAVTLTANTNLGWMFTGWSGDASEADNPLTVTISGNKSITANFQPTLVVANTNDSGPGSLRQAIADAPSTASHLVTFATGPSGTVSLNSELVIAQNMSIAGPGANMLTVDGNGTNRVFIVSGGNVSISGLTIANGIAGISNNATLSVDGCVISGHNGQAVRNDVNGVMSLNNSTICSNATGFSGAGIANLSTLGVTNCTISANRALGTAFGGGIFNSGSATVVSSTICSNSANRGGGLYSSTSTVTNGNTLITGNGGAFPDVNATVSSLGYNLISRTNGSGGWAASDLTGSSITPLDARLGPLQNNGGTTLTHALSAGSPALDAGKSFGVVTDQRGLPRPFDDPLIPNAVGGDGSDIGALEATRTIIPTLAILLTLTNTVIISWPSPSTGFELEQNTSLANPTGWSAFGGTINDNSTTRSVTISPPTGNVFFRLGR